MMNLSTTEKKVRALLINVAKGKAVSKRPGRISYKEVWQHIRKDEKWGRACTSAVVGWITQISAYELREGRPPLNEIVTPANKLIPTDEWGNAKVGIKSHLKRLSGVIAPYRTHEDAQQACWSHWSNDSKQAPRSANTELQVEEGYREDREASFVRRNREIINEAKKRDNFKCQACDLKLVANGRPIVDCHHKLPLSHFIGTRVTRLSDLICLCPTCHRIAHTKPYPLEAEEIRTLRGL